ncbi:MAG: hypothetical protein U5K81_12870 [Trueperaceae bacterium]|nr:hypothetical protein [Trueperaceae bacterium]
MKIFEPAMRHLLDTYIRAEETETLSRFDDHTLVDLILQQGPGAIDTLPDGIKRNEDAVASTIENNVRKLIIDESAVNPKYYERMSELLDALIQQRKQRALNYKEYLAKIVELAKHAKQPHTSTAYPDRIATPALQALYDNLDGNEPIALAVDQAIRDNRLDGWRSNRFKQRKLRNAIKTALGPHTDRTDEIFEIVTNQREY